MTGFFQNQRNRLARLRDRYVGECIEHFPLKDGRADGTRKKRAIVAVLGLDDVREREIRGRGRADFEVAVIAGAGVLQVDHVRYPDIRFKKGDRVRAVGRSGGPVFEVSKVEDRRRDWLTVHLDEV